MKHSRQATEGAKTSRVWTSSEMEARSDPAGRSPASPTLSPASPTFFAASLLPMTLVAALLVAMLLVALGSLWLPLSSRELALVGVTVWLTELLVLLPVQWYVSRTRLDRPLKRLQQELAGGAVWTEEEVGAFSGLRRVLTQVREEVVAEKRGRETEHEQILELASRIEERNSHDTAIRQAGERLGQVSDLRGYLLEAERIIREGWTADRMLALLLPEGGGEPEVVHGLQDGDGVSPGYRRSALPVPLKEAIRRGAYVETGLPFSHDQHFPSARSCAVLSLEHRGAVRGLLYAISDSPEVDRPELLIRLRPLLSLGFSRAMYAEELSEAEIRDALTGVYTQNHFLALFRREVARAVRYSRPLSCICFDIDALGRMNEEYGAHIGDKVIAEVAQLVSEQTRSSDVLGRSVGGEFTLLLPETGAEIGEGVAERIRLAVETHTFVVQRRSVEHLTVSAGVASYAAGGAAGGHDLVERARLALNAAKRSGRNRVVVANPG